MKTIISILGLFLTITAVSASYNLYINEHETMRLLGKLTGRKLGFFIFIIAPPTTTTLCSTFVESRLRRREEKKKFSSGFEACNYSVHFHKMPVCVRY